jgi:hypothetical protein
MKLLEDLLIQEAADLLVQFDKASSLGSGTSQEIADFRENAFRDFVRRFYPAPHHVVKGKARDSFDSPVSCSIDCLILNPEHPHLVDSQGKFQLILADGVDIALEVKPDITQKDELHRGLQQCTSIKKLRRTQSPIFTIDDLPAEVLEMSRQIPFFLYTRKAKDPTKILDDIQSYYLENDVPVIDQLDFIAIHNVGILSHVKHASLCWWKSKFDEVNRTGWFFENWGQRTLAGLLLSMNSVYHSRPTMLGRVLDPYLRQFARPIDRLRDCMRRST